MSFGHPFVPYGPSLHNPQFLLAAAAAAAAAASASGNNIGNGGNPSNSSSKASTGSAPSDPSPSIGPGSSQSIFAYPPSSSTSVTSNSAVNLLTHSSESGDMSAEGLRLLAAAGGHHNLVLPPPGQSLIPSSQAGPGAGPPMPPMFAGLPSLDPYRLPPPPFGLYSGGISPAGGPLDLKVPDGLPPPPFAHPAPSAMTPFYYDPAFGSGYPYAADRFGNPLDLNGARRKNATRETTAALKAWLYEHRKNPYPTKGEKIMLAIITKMTLTQVSTWFANARRRLKKENKMTWSPRNRPGEDDDGVDGSSNTQENSGGARPGSSLSSLGDDARDGDDDDVEDLGPDTVAVPCNLDEESAKRLIHGSMKGEGDDKAEPSASVKRAAETEDASSSPKKPKIWSIAETVASPDPSPQKSKPPAESPQQQHLHHQQGPYHFTFPPWPHMAAAAAFAGRNPLMPPPNSGSASVGGAPSFPFASMPPGPFAIPTSMSSLPHPHQLRPELFARNFFAPMPPSAPMMNAAAAAAATGLPGFLNGFSFGCGPPSFPFGFGVPGVAGVSNGPVGAQTVPSQQQPQAQAQNGAGNEAGGSSDSDQQQESKPRVVVSSVSPVSSNGGRRSSTSSQEPKANTSS